MTEFSILFLASFKQPPDTMTQCNLCGHCLRYSCFKKNFSKQHGLKLHAVHSLQKEDVSEPLLIRDLLQFGSHKRPPPIIDL